MKTTIFPPVPPESVLLCEQQLEVTIASASLLKYNIEILAKSKHILSPEFCYTEIESLWEILKQVGFFPWEKKKS